VFPTVIAGIEGIGRGQDRESLMMFLSTISQAMGPEMMMKFINPEEAIKRLAASQGIDTLKLVKTEAERNAEMSQMMSQNAQSSLIGQAGNIIKAPLLDPSKNPEALDSLRNATAAFGQTAQPTTAPPAGAPQ
jgi:hypothetical protein